MSDPAITEISRRLQLRTDDIARALIARYSEEIVDYAASSADFLEGDVLDVTRRLLTDLFENVASGSVMPTEAQLAAYRQLLARRPHQGIALPSIQHAFRIFGELVYGELSTSASQDRPDELRAAIAAGAIVMRFAHEVIGVVTQTYLDELEDVTGDREIVSRSLLDAVLSGRSSAPSTRRDARILGIELIPQSVVVVARSPTGEEHRPRTLRAAAMKLRAELLRHLGSGRALVGVREGEVVALCAVPKPSDLEAVTKAAHAAAQQLDAAGMSIGVGTWHPLAEEIPAAYAEAREAADIAVRTGVRGRALVYDDVLIDHILRSNENAGRVIAAALAPLREYDERRNAGLVDTLRAYVDANFSITRAARAMNLHNNTVIYRLDRVRELTGRDPRRSRDVVFFALGLRLDADAEP
jgi:sugar diacid utilization regulator